MDNFPITIRIQTDDKAMDWVVEHPKHIKFLDIIEAINQVVNDSMSAQAFEYEDEDGDRITVRSDDEQEAMLDYYVSVADDVGPLIIYPRTGKSADKRNKMGLKIQTQEQQNHAKQNVPNAKQDLSSHSNNTETPMDESPLDSGSKKRSGDIREILACGNISDMDIETFRVLGTGNCGIVYQGRHKPTGMPIAVKEIPLDISVDAKKQIISELEVLHRCDSPTIIAFYGAYFKENRISICAEWMDGGSLDQYGQIEEQILGIISVAVVRGLQYLWSLKIMHRDMKPSNILVNTHGCVKLCDFGVSIQLIDSIAKTFIGTSAYMAPERITGHEYSIQSEVWSLGVSLFEMATDKFPYESAKKAVAKPLDLLKSIVEKEPPQLTKGMFSDAFVDFVSRCMMKEPMKRPAPQALMRHPYIAAYEDAENAIVAQWVQQRLPFLKSKPNTG